MKFQRAIFSSKIVFLAANATMSGMLLWDMGGRAKLFALAVPLACAVCLWRRSLPLVLAALGASLPFFGFQSYSAHAQVMHFLVSVAALALLLDTGERRPAEGFGPLRLWLMGFVGVMLAGLPLLPFGEMASALRETGPLGLARMLAYSVAASSFYAVAALDRLALYALFAWELSRTREDEPLMAMARGVAASIPAALAFGLAEYFLARGTAYAMSDRLTSLFLNPGWFAEYVCVGFPLLFLLGRGRGRWFLFALLAVALAAMVLTMARAAWLVSGVLAMGCVVAATGGFDLFSLDYRRMAKGALLGLAAVAVVGVGVYGALSATRVSLLNFPLATMIAQRLEKFSETPRPLVFKSGVLIGLESPVSGMGYETYAWHYPHLMDAPAGRMAREIPRDAEMFEATHNLFIQIFSGAGLLGLAAWVFLAFRAAQLALRAHRLRADAMSLAALFSLAAFHGFGFFQEMIYIPAVWLLFFVVLAWCLRLEDAHGGWIADFTERRAGRAVALAVLAALGLNLSNAGFAAMAARLGLDAYPAPGSQDVQGLSGPEVVSGREVLWSSGASSFLLRGEGPWRFTAGVPHPDMTTRPVRVALSARGRVLWEKVFDASTGREASFEIGRDAVKSGERVFLTASRLYFPLTSGIKDYRALGVWIAGPGLSR
ncbi:O-antigen ligase family protein [Fundidesulfovibrio terrae]|uniref:O-antigen ligase family protein n=1 Tax=Fundidesulfovibrio terrae TaxID=2922866 RepID=UPI001FAFEB8E|nr:O-antigen ligase family protein [Fundidesulfovibrio terrae]